MKKIIFMMSAGLILASCNKDIEFCIDGNMNPATPGTYTYTWCGTGADEVSMSGGSNGGGIFLGESVTFDFDTKGDHYITVYAENSRKELSENFLISVGAYEARVEPKQCDGNYVQSSNGMLMAYLYADMPNLQSDLRNSNKANCTDSVALESSYYYQHTMDNPGPSYVGGLKNIANGNYIVYVQEEGIYGRNNLLDLFVYGSSSTLMVANGDWDDLYSPVLSESYNQAPLNLFSKTFLLSEVWVNGSNTGVPTCNADDNIIFNIDGSWLYDIGTDNCSGNQSNSVGTYTGFSSCTNPEGSSVSMTVSSGSLSGLSSVYMTFNSANQVQLTMYDGTNTIIQKFQAQ